VLFWSEFLVLDAKFTHLASNTKNSLQNNTSGAQILQEEEFIHHEIFEKNCYEPLQPIDGAPGPNRGAGRISFPGWIGFFEGQEPPLRPSKNAALQLQKFYGGQFKT
jgi:hypothetical protein